MASAQLYISSSPRVISEDCISEGSQSSSSHVLSDEDTNSLDSDGAPDSKVAPNSEVAVLTPEEIEALRRYSHSVQNFTYQLFESFRIAAEARATTPACDTSVPSKASTTKVVDKNISNTVAVFHSTVVMPPSETSAANIVGTAVAGRRKLSDYPRRKARGSSFPEHTGL